MGDNDVPELQLMAACPGGRSDDVRPDRLFRCDAGGGCRAVRNPRSGKSRGRDDVRAIKDFVRNNQISAASDYCGGRADVISRVLSAGLGEWGKDERLISAAMERAIGAQTVRLEKYVGVLGTIGSVAVYIGLFGTVVGIMSALHDIGTTSISGGMSQAITGVAEALICTAAGLIVAVSAVVAYNYFVRRINVLIAEMELSASEFLALAMSRNSRS